jgi:hypothetical protein
MGSERFTVLTSFFFDIFLLNFSMRSAPDISTTFCFFCCIVCPCALALLCQGISEYGFTAGVALLSLLGLYLQTSAAAEYARTVSTCWAYAVALLPAVLLLALTRHPGTEAVSGGHTLAGAVLMFVIASSVIASLGFYFLLKRNSTSNELSTVAVALVLLGLAWLFAQNFALALLCYLWVFPTAWLLSRWRGRRGEVATSEGSTSVDATGISADSNPESSQEVPETSVKDTSVKVTPLKSGRFKWGVLFIWLVQLFLWTTMMDFTLLRNNWAEVSDPVACCWSLCLFIYLVVSVYVSTDGRFSISIYSRDSLDTSFVGVLDLVIVNPLWFGHYMLLTLSECGDRQFFCQNFQKRFVILNRYSKLDSLILSYSAGAEGCETCSCQVIHQKKLRNIIRTPTVG